MDSQYGGTSFSSRGASQHAAQGASQLAAPSQPDPREHAHQDSQEGKSFPRVGKGKSFRWGGRRKTVREWLWEGVVNPSVGYGICAAALWPSPMPVTSRSGFQVLGSYSWQVNGKTSYKVPGSAPVWQQGIQLPIQLQKDCVTHPRRASSGPVAQHPFEPLFEATRTMSPSFRFDDVDIVVSRNSLRRLLDFCGHGYRWGFRLELLMVHNTLFIERCEMHPEFLTGQGGSRGFGHNFERAFTKFPSGENNNAGYHRCLRYHIGDLNCAVQFEVDARFGEPETTKIDAEAEDVGLSLARLTLAETKGGGGVSKESSLAPQSAVIEAKTLLADRDWDRDLPQLWFGRVPWLMIGRHDAGLFTSVDVVDTGPRLAEWEEDSQPQLRKLATLLTQLRQAVTMFGGRNCAAIHQPGGLSGPVIYVCESKLGRRALPDDFIQHAWAPAKGATGEI